MLKQNVKELTIEERLSHISKFFSQDLRYMDPSEGTKEELELYEAISIFHRGPSSKASIYMGLQDRYGSSDAIRNKFLYLFEGDNPKYSKIINKLCGDIRAIYKFMRIGELKEEKGKLNNYLFSVFNHPYYIKIGESTNERIQEDLVKARKMARDYLAYDESLYIEDFIKKYELTNDEYCLLKALLLTQDRPTYDAFVAKQRKNIEMKKKSIEKRMERIKMVSEGKYIFPNKIDKDIYFMSLLPRCNDEDMYSFGLPPRATLRNNFVTLYKYFFGKISREATQLAIDNMAVKGSYTLSNSKMTKKEALNMSFRIDESELESKENKENKENKPEEKEKHILELSKDQKEQIIKYMEARNIVFSSRLFVLLANSILRHKRDMNRKYFILIKDIGICNAIGSKEKASVFTKAKKIAKHVPSKKELEEINK